MLKHVLAVSPEWRAVLRKLRGASWLWVAVLDALRPSKVQSVRACPAIPEFYWNDCGPMPWAILKDYRGKWHVLPNYVQSAIYRGEMFYRVREETAEEWCDRQW
ncbi:hypothetical protein GCM10011335_37140 [Aureimonas glaciei]|uniref:Uncharacterized protein n=1 Tax=Aureimonas glaciei TaxID=1776957 RepID=A0A916Y4P4_9HYPH|nr:hypothetical protein GCM10011335_37140 [Aureimonas glaciei]